MVNKTSPRFKVLEPALDFSPQNYSPQNTGALPLGSSQEEIMRDLVKRYGPSVEESTKDIKTENIIIPEKLISKHNFRSFRLRGYNDFYVEPGYSVLVFRKGKFEKEFHDGIIKPTMFGYTDLIEVYRGDIKHTIRFPLLFARNVEQPSSTQPLILPATLSLIYRVRDAPKFYEECHSADQNIKDNLKDLVIRGFNGNYRFISNVNFSLITEEEHNKIKNKLKEDFGKSFEDKGIELKSEVVFFIEPLPISKKIRGVSSIYNEILRTSSAIVVSRNSIETERIDSETRLLEAKNRYKQLERKIEHDIETEDTKGKLELDKLNQGSEREKQWEQAELETKIDDIRFELRKRVLEYASKFSPNLEKLLMEKDDITVFSVISDLRAINRYAIVGEYDDTKIQEILNRAVEQRFKEKENLSEAEVYRIKNPDIVRITEAALSNSKAEFNFNLGEEKLERLIKDLVSLVSSFVGKKDEEKP